MYVAKETERRFGKHKEFEVFSSDNSLGLYSRTGLSNSLVAVDHPVRDASPERPYLLFIDRDTITIF